MTDRSTTFKDLVHASGWRQINGPLFRKYVALFLAVVFVVLLINGLLEIGFAYQDTRFHSFASNVSRRRRPLPKSGSSSGRSKVRSAGPRSCRGRRAPSISASSMDRACCAKCRRSPS